MLWIMKKGVIVRACFEFGTQENGDLEDDNRAVKEGGAGHEQNEYCGTSE
jgi:hypothetical protein